MAARKLAVSTPSFFSNPIKTVKYWFHSTSPDTKIGEEVSLEDKLSHLNISEKDVAFIINQGQDYLDKPETLAQKLSFEVELAKVALDVLRAHRISQNTKEEIKNCEQSPKEKLENPQDIEPLKNIDEDVDSTYLESKENEPLTEHDKMVIKEGLKDGFSMTEIAEELNLSEKKINTYVENKLISFKGKDGVMVLDIINRRFKRLPAAKLKEMIARKDLKLQENICFELEKSNQDEYATVKDYFTRFEDSQNFYKIDGTFSIEAKTCIRASTLDNVGELSLKLNRMERLIRDYLLRYSPDLELLSSCEQEQLKQIQNMKDNFGGEMQISHTTYRMIISDSFDNLIKKAKKLDGSPMKILIELLPLVFYYIKCSLPLDELTQIISNTTKISLTTLDIFHLIFQMSDPVVRGLCIEHYSFSNPVPFYYPILGPYPPERTSCQFEICKELWYSLQQFSGLVSFGLGWASWNPIGKSHLLDLMFETDFVKGSPQNSPFHLGSIDIQMTKNLFGLKDSNESTQWAYMDCHGCSDFNLIQDICQNLDIALIHVSYSDYTENYPRLLEDLKKITNHTEHVYVLIRDCTDTELSPKQISVDKKKYHFLFIGNLLNFGQNDLRSSTLREIGYKVLHSASSKPIGTDYLEKLLLRQSNWNISEKELIQSIKNDICSNVQDRNKINFSFLSYYPHFIEYMRCFYEVSREIDQKGIDALNGKCDQLAKDLEDAKMSAVVLHFNEILSHENSTLILWKLSQELSMLSKQTLPDINQTVYTLEILWREALLSNKYNLTEKIEKQQVNDYPKTFSSHFSNHVERGEPFELIDGDNLRFFNQDINILLSKFYEKQNNGAISLQNKQRPPIVVSIFGPQSSGKSTLLNYCFGCKFLTSAGRCTKGIYASLSKLSQPINNSEHFLILDTEGLDAIERGNTIQDTSCIHFDRTMVLFCLAVSQVVIINVKGDIGEEMRNLLQICAYSLNKLKVSKVAAPKIFFVLNQQADPDPNKHLSSINTLLRKLNEESYVMETEGLKISDLIAVSEENLFVLPSAFNSESLNTQMTKLFDSKLCKSSPTIDFANRCADLRLSIIRQLKADTSDNESSFNTMSEWLEMSGVIWDTIIKYQDIVKYRNVEELKCSNKLNVIVGGLVKSTIHSKKKEYENMTKEVIKKIKEITKSSPTKVMLEDVKKDLDIVFKEHWEKALADFEAQCKDDSLLKRMGYICDEAKLNLNRLIYIEKKIYEDKLKFEVKARLTEIKLTEKMAKFQEAIEKNADRYLEFNLEEQKKEFESVWISCFIDDTKEEEETDLDEKFDDLYSVFRMESKTMENKNLIYDLFRKLKFKLDKIIEELYKEMLSKFCGEITNFSGADRFIYPWRENRVPLKDMRPFTEKLKCEYLSKESLYSMKIRNKKPNLDFRKFVPTECYPLIRYCSGYYNHPDIIWKLEKRKQILLLASKLKDPINPERSTWEKLITDISKRVQEFTEIDQMVSHSTVKEIVDFLSRTCKLVNYEINFIEAKLTNAAERKISTLAFAFAFQSILNAKFEEQREDISKEKEKKDNDLKYFLQKIENRKLARGNWDRKEMRKSDLIFANKFAADFLAALGRGVSTAFERSIYEEYFEKEADRLSHKKILLQANEKMTEKIQYASKSLEEERLKEYKTHLLNQIKAQNQPLLGMPSIPNPLPKDFPYPNLPIEENNFVVQFICNRIQTLKNLYQEEWKKLSKRLYAKIFGNMKIKFIKQISTVKDVLKDFLKVLEGMCKEKDRLLEVGTDSDSNFELSIKAAAEESARESDPKTREAPFKAMVLFLEKYLNPKVSPGEFNQFFTSGFGVDGVKMIKHHDTYVLFEKPHHPAQVLNEEIFKMLTDTNMFRSTETIFNIKMYVQEFLRTLNCYEYKVTSADYEKIVKDTKEKFEARVTNCLCKCPSCGKFCEKEIHPQEGKCQILTGHQFCSMGGNVWNTNEDRTAILLMCEDYKEDSPVLIPLQDMKWSEFKEKCDQWDWTLPTDKKYAALQKENRDRMKNIWNIFGRGILKYYENRDTQITYIPYTSPREIYESLFDLKYYVCFVIDGTDLMGEAINLVKNWVSDFMEDAALGGTPYFKVIVYHGHAVSGKECVEKFPNNSEFTTEGEGIQDFIDKITTYGGDGTESAMLHGLATATTQSDWKVGFGVKNIIPHFYCEPTEGHFDIFTARGKCEKGCPFKWKGHIRDKIDKLEVNYRRQCLIKSTHPDFKNKSGKPISYKIPSEYTLHSGEKTKPKDGILINYKADN